MRLHVLAVPLALFALKPALSGNGDPGASAVSSPRPVRYRLVVIGTFGGPNSTYNVFSRIGRNDGTFVGASNTADQDHFAPDQCFDGTCFVQHAWQWNRGELTDLGALREGYSSYTDAINSRGLIVGQSQNGVFDPLTGTPVLFLATVWDHGKTKNLGTLGGGNSIAIAATDDGFVMGAAENGIPDASGYTIFDGVSQIRAFGWNGTGDIFDLGTLGGTYAFPGDMNDHGEVVGESSTTSVPDPDGIVPKHPFLWARGRMHDLGTLGGHFAGSGAINNRGQVAGSSTLQGDQVVHPFLWQDGKMTDLGTLGGTFALGEWISEAGQVIGIGSHCQRRPSRPDLGARQHNRTVATIAMWRPSGGGNPRLYFPPPFSRIAWTSPRKLKYRSEAPPAVSTGTNNPRPSVDHSMGPTSLKSGIWTVWMTSPSSERISIGRPAPRIAANRLPSEESARPQSL